MILEALVILSFVFSGFTALYALGLRGWPLLPLGFIVGMSLAILTGAVLVGLNMVVSPLLNLGLLMVAAAVYWAWYYGRKGGPRPSRKGILLTATVASATFGFTALLYVLLEPYTYIKHVDSVEYLAIGTMLSEDTFFKGVSLYQLQKRLLAVPFMHIYANVTDAYFLVTVTPLLALSTIGAMAWVWLKGLAGKVNPGALYIFVTLGVLLLLTNNRFIMHSTYINSHLFFAALLVLLVGCFWMLAVKASVPKKVLYVLPLLIIPVFILARAEAVLFVPIALLPVLLSNNTPLRYRQLLLGVLGASVVVWQVFLLALYQIHRSHMQVDSAYGFLVIGLVIVASAVVMGVKPLGRVMKFLEDNRKIVLWITEGGLWLALLALVVRDPTVFTSSLEALFRNAFYGGNNMWGASLAVLSILVIAMLLLSKSPKQVYLRFAITTFVPLVFLIAYLRDGAYRVGGGDSLVRMLMHIAPLMVVYIVVAMAAGKQRFNVAELKKRTKALVTGKQ